MSVPEQRHLLLQRVIGGDHAVRPPCRHPAGLERGGAQPEEEPVDDRLHAARPAGLHPHPDGFACGLGLAGRRRPARRKHLQGRVVDAGMLERRESASPFVFVVHQPLYGCGRHHRGQMVDVLRRAAESGAIEQMPRTCAIPVRRLDRRKIVHPIVFRSHRAVPEIGSDRPLSSATIYTAFPLGAHIPFCATQATRPAAIGLDIPDTRGAPLSRHRTQTDCLDQCGLLCLGRDHFLSCFLRDAVV